MHLVKRLGIVVIAAVFSSLAGAGLAKLATEEIKTRPFVPPLDRIIYGSSSDQIIRRVTLGLNMNALVKLTTPLEDWRKGTRVPALALLTARDNADLLRLVVNLAPRIETATLIDALCVAARQGHGGKLTVLADKLERRHDRVFCLGGQAPSEIAYANGHDGAHSLLKSRGL
ncbi:MAG: hypothetical protein MI753_07235 [Hyphomicrobiales bacterium]|nr:hypothetical protein [Hyphomicrobiales bacterium]